MDNLCEEEDGFDWSMYETEKRSEFEDTLPLHDFAKMKLSLVFIGKVTYRTFNYWLHTLPD